VGRAWGWLLAGWLLATVRVLVPPLAGDEATLRSRMPGSRASASEVPDLARLSPRELRSLPGIGEARAVAIAKASWERGRLEIEDLDSVPMIGDG
jgi:DNA uptake protein ComE-like DNA-binding protein